MKRFEGMGTTEPIKVEGKTIEDVLEQINGGDVIAFYRPDDFVIDVYGSEVSDEDAEADINGELADLILYETDED